MEKSLKNALQKAIHTFYEKDHDLIQIKGTERSCVFRIGVHMQEEMKLDENLKNLSLDCEYNKKGGNPKKISGVLIRPDLIIHERGSNNSNILAIEFKGWWKKRPHDKDIEKLRTLTNSTYGYSYQFAIFVRLEKEEENTTYRYFEKGQERTGK